MSKFRRRNSSGELDVFEAALYYSGEVHEANLIGIRGAVAKRRSVDAPGREITTELLIQRLAKSDCQSEDKGGRQPCPGAKLASLIRSFFNQVISKKKASEYLAKQAKRSSSEGCRQKATPLSSKREALRDGRSTESADECTANARAAPRGEALIVKAGERRGRSEEDEGGGSDSSSDLFELESYAMGVCNSKSYLFMRPTWKMM